MRLRLFEEGEGRALGVRVRHMVRVRGEGWVQKVLGLPELSREGFPPRGKLARSFKAVGKLIDRRNWLPDLLGAQLRQGYRRR